MYLTSYADDKKLERAKTTEPFGYILEPFTGRNLYAAVEMALYKHKMENMLKKSEEKYRTLAENAMDGIYIINPDEGFEYVNPAFEKIFGYKAEELCRKDFNFFDLIHSGDKKLIVEREEERKKGKKLPSIYSFRAIAKDGKLKHVEVHTVPLPGEKVRILGILREITERKQMEEELKKKVEERTAELAKTNKELEALSKNLDEKVKEIDKMKTEFISVVSHEIRTPLTSMKNAVDLILEGTAGAINENQRRFLSMAYRNINRLSDIINGHLDISKIESGTIKMELKPLDLGISFNMAIASLTSETKEKSISIHNEVPSDLPQVYGDSNRLEQIFINLLNNAIKYTPEGGRIYISAKEYELDDNFIEVSVTDTGIGINPYKLEKIFDKFYQVENSITRETKGTGLGLSIVKGLVELQRGKIWVESEKGKGSKFTFTLPKYNPERALKYYLDREIAGAGEKGAPLSLIMLKIEQFEYLNEAYGEKEALELLDEVKQVIQDTARKTTDVIKTQTVGRIIMILAYTPKEGAFALRSRLSEVLSKQTFTVSKRSIKINLASRVATYPEDGVTGDELIKKAQSQFIVDSSQTKKE